MQKVFIRGVKGRGKEVIAKLVALGGKNFGEYRGDSDNYFYYINADGEIDILPTKSYCGTMITWIGTEIFLDKPIEESRPKPKFKVGDKVHIMSDKSVYTITDRKDNGDCNLNGGGYYNERYLKLANTLKKNDPVMVSDNGEDWDAAFFEYDDLVTIGADIEGRISFHTEYIVPLEDFDFNDLESNIKRSVV